MAKQDCDTGTPASPKAPVNAPKAPAQGGIAGTFDPNYQTMAGLGEDVFGGDKGAGGGGGGGGGGFGGGGGGGGFGGGGGGFGAGGGAPPPPAVPPPPPQPPAQGGMAGTYDPNYQTLAGVGNDVFDRK